MAANESYHVTPASVKVEFLSDPLRVTYDLICDLAARSGKCYACAAWLSQRLGISESQLSRRLKQLRQFGLLVIEHVPGLRRLLVPCKPDADSPPTSIYIENQQTAPARGVAPADEAEAPPAAAALVKQGVKPPVATALVREKGEKACLSQVEALARRTNVRDAAAYLVAAIKGDWGLPAPVREKPKVYYVRRERPKETQKTQGAGERLDVRGMLRGLHSLSGYSRQQANSVMGEL